MSSTSSAGSDLERAKRKRVVTIGAHRRLEENGYEQPSRFLWSLGISNHQVGYQLHTTVVVEQVEEGTSTSTQIVRCV